MVLLELHADVLRPRAYPAAPQPRRAVLHVPRVAGASASAIHTLVATAGFRTAWIDWQKTLDLSLQRALLTSDESAPHPTHRC